MDQTTAEPFRDVSYLAAIQYMIRYLRNSEKVVTPWNVHRLAAVSLCLANKMYGPDEIMLNSWFALASTQGLQGLALNFIDCHLKLHIDIAFITLIL